MRNLFFRTVISKRRNLLTEIVFNPELDSSLSSQTDKGAWSSTLISALGSTRTLTLKHTPSGAASTNTIWDTGTIFYSASLTGSMTIGSNAEITGFGVTSSETVKTAADLSSGSAVIRIEGNGNWLMIKLSLGASGDTYSISGNPDGVKGIGIESTMTLYPPEELPLVDANEPATAMFEDWSTGVAGATQTISFNDQQPDIVWEDAEKAAEIGPVPYTRSTSVFSIGTGGDTFDIGVHRFRLPATCNDEVTAPVYQVLVAFSPGTNRWTTYPMMDTYDIATDNTYPTAFKIYLKNSTGATLHTFEMRDGLPINASSLSQTRDGSNAWRPWVNLGMTLYYCSHRLKLSTNGTKYYNGSLSANWLQRPKLMKSNEVSNAAIVTFGSLISQYSGFLQFMAMPQWSMPSNASTDALDPSTDPNVFLTSNPSGTDTSGVNRPTRAVGWGYEPGAMNAGHDWRPGPGGQRFERFFVPTQLAIYLTDKTGSRTQGSVPWRTLCDEYGKGMFNHSHHYVKNARTLDTVPFSQAAYGNIGYAYGYYNGSTTPSDPTTVIHTRGVPNGGVWPAADKNGRRHFSGWMLDNQHAYNSPGWYFTHFNSVAHAYSQKLRYYAVIYAWNKYYAAPSSSPVDLAGNHADTNYMLRQHAWRWLHLAMMWKQSSAHPLFVSRAEVEEVWRIELESIYNNIVVPTTNPAHVNYNHVAFKTLRNLGVLGETVVSGSDHYLKPHHTDIRLYLFGVMTLMKKMGCWSALRNINSMCATALDFTIERYKIWVIDHINATKLRDITWDASVYKFTDPVPTGTPITVPDSWAALGASRWPDDGSDLVRNADGTPFLTGQYSARERNQYQHMHIQAAYGFRDHWSDYGFTGVDTACALCDDFEAYVAAQVAGGGAEYKWRFTAAGPIQTTA